MRGLTTKDTLLRRGAMQGKRRGEKRPRTADHRLQTSEEGIPELSVLGGLLFKMPLLILAESSLRK
jgi:hypothetical protein